MENRNNNNEAETVVDVATRCQQNYYELLSDWNKYSIKELQYLKNFISYALFGPPQLIDGNYTYESTQLNVIEMLYTLIIETNQNEDPRYIYCGLIYNVIYFENSIIKESTEKTENINKIHGDSVESQESRNKKLEKHVFPIPVFKIRRCSFVNGWKKVLCSYIDNEGRFYENWSDYITTNTLPECTMVLPRDGYYQADPSLDSSDMYSSVWLQIEKSPACSAVSDALKKIDVLNCIAGLGGLGIAIASLAIPIAAPIAIAGGVSAALNGVWTFGRCSYQLIDRNNHKQSINVTDGHALSAWIGIAGCTLGLASSGSTTVLTKAIQNGTSIGRAARVAYNSIIIGNMVINGVGIGVKSYSMYAGYAEQGEISYQDLFLLSTHIFFFSSSIINVKLAGELINSTQENVLKEYEDNLRTRRHRQEFKSLAREKGVGMDGVSKNEEIIRTINKIENKDEFFENLSRNRKELNAAKAKASIANGEVKINNPKKPSQPSAKPKVPEVPKVPKVKIPNPQLLKKSDINLSPKISNVWYNDSVLILHAQFARNTALSCTQLVSYTDEILQDIECLENKEFIFTKLCNIVLIIISLVDLEKTDKAEVAVTLEKLYAEVFTFIWKRVKENMKKRNTTISCILVKNEFIIINELDVMEKHLQVEAKVKEMFQAFLQYTSLKIFPQRKIVQ